MFERRHEPLASQSTFIMRVLYSVLVGWTCIALALYIGMLGYHVFEKMPWVDAFANAAMILSGMGPLGPLNTSEGKIFAGCYALFSGLSFIFIIMLIFSPILHRMFHLFHLESDDGIK